MNAESTYNNLKFLIELEFTPHLNLERFTVNFIAKNGENK